MNTAAFKVAAASIFVVSTLLVTANADEAEKPDVSAWSFLEGEWIATAPDGNKSEFSCKLNDAKTCYVVTSPIFHGTLGVDLSSDHPMLSLGYHPGVGYSVGHWKRESEAKVSGGFWMVDKDGKKIEHTSDFDKTDDGFTYTIDGNQVHRWRKKN